MSTIAQETTELSMQLSRRILAVKSSPTVALNGKVKALAKEGVKVLNFGVGEPDFSTPASIVQAGIKALEAGRTKYGPAGGSPELRNAIAAKLERENRLKFPADRIVVGIGAKEILFHCFLALLNEGDEVLIPSPYWVSYPDQVIAAGGKPVMLPLPEDIAKTPLRIEDLEKHATARTVGIVLNSPNNPAGYMFDEGFLKELGAYLLTKPWWIISDEIYEYLAFDKPHRSLLELYPQLADRFFYVNGLSKSFAMTGWRVGYVAGPEPAMKLVRDLQSHSSTCLPPFVEDAAVFALGKGKTLVEKEIALMKSRRDLAMQSLAKLPGIRYVQPHGAFYIFIDVRAALRGKTMVQDAFGLSDYLLTKHHVAMVPGEGFGAPGFLRMSYATDEASIVEGLARLGKALGELT
jgi:aspartate aminotransferase